ncbi:hypothetical protein M8818_001694 [Zalaria obscura]|uniref:Uncharacterized protein n=1 Tax=Zalaria obscura TaxID=2024903 RepID=A0ACC3SJ27_9PEZI
MFQLSQGLQNNGPHTMTAHPAMANEAQDQVSAVHPTSHTAVESTSGNAAPVPLSDTNNYNSPPYPVYNPVNSHQQTYANHTSTTTMAYTSHPYWAPIRGTHALQINMADQLAFTNHRDADLTRKIASFFFLLQALRMRGNREENTPARVMQFLASSLVANTVADSGRRAYAGGFDGSGNGDGDAETILKFYGLAAVVMEKIKQERVEWEEEMRGRSRVRKGGGRGVHGNGVDSEGEAVDGTFGHRNGGPVDGRGDADAEGNGQESRDTKVLPDRSTDVRKEERLNGEQKQSSSLTNVRSEAKAEQLSH